MANCQMSTARELTVVTGLPTEEVTLTWTIKNFKTAYALAKSSAEDGKKYFANLTFPAGASIGVPAEWEYYFKQAGEEGMEFYLENRGVHKVLANYVVNIQKKDGGDFELFIKQVGNRIFNALGSESPAWGWDEFATMSELLTEGFLTTAPDDDLTLKLKLTIFGNKIEASDTSSIKILPSCKTPLGMLSADFGKLLEDNEGADVNLNLKRKHEGDEDDEDVQIKAHKNILGARSPVFQAMFRSGMQETNGEVHIPDIEPDTMQIVLKFMYTGVVDGEWTSVAENLILAADKYELPQLKEFMEENMALACTPQNAHELMKTANLFNMPVALKNIQEYIKENLTAVLDDMVKN